MRPAIRNVRDSRRRSSAASSPDCTPAPVVQLREAEHATPGPLTWNQYLRFQGDALEMMGLPPMGAVSLGFPWLPGPPTKRRRPKCQRRPPQQGARAQLEIHYVEAEYPERAPGRPYSIFARKRLTDAERAYKPESDRVLARYDHLRPTQAPDDCRPGMPKGLRPCPWAACPHHLGVTVNDSRSIKVDHGHLDFEKLEETCAIDVARQGKQTGVRVAKLLGITVDRVRQAEREMRQRMTRKFRTIAGEYGIEDSDPEVAQ